MITRLKDRPAIVPVQAGTLKVPGASLYYEVRGSGPVLLMIPGGPADAGVFADLAGLLADRYTVVTYDPRGHSQSVLDGPPEAVPVEVHADDACRVLEAVGREAACVFGSSGGAVIGLDLVARHTERVRILVAHEPPVVELLPDRAHWRALIEEVEGTRRTQGALPAMATYRAAVEAGGPMASDRSQAAPAPAEAELMSRMMQNFDLFVAHEVRAISKYVPDIAALHSSSARVVVAGGQESGTQGAYRAATALAGQLGTYLVYFPGAHGGFMTHAEAFAECLRATLDTA